MSRKDYALVLKFKLDERLPSYSDMEGYVPGFVDSFFNRRSTRVNHNATEIWVRVDAPENEDTTDSLRRMKNRLETPSDELKYYERTLSLSSEDVDISHMRVEEYIEKTEHSAAIVNKNWENVVFNIIHEDETSVVLAQENDSSVIITASTYAINYTGEKAERVSSLQEGQRVKATMNSNSGFAPNWNFESVEVL